MPPKLVPADPDHERFDAVGWAAVWGVIGAAVGVLGAAALGWSAWGALALLLVLGVPSALAPIARWRAHHVDLDRIPVGHLDPSWRSVVDRAATSATRLERAAEQAPAGAVADHLAGLAAAGRSHLDAVCEAGTTVAGLDPTARGRLLDDARSTAERLGRLADAAERLRAAQQRQQEPDPLGALIEATDHLTSTLDGDELRRSADPFSARGAGGRPGPVSPTTDR